MVYLDDAARRVAGAQDRGGQRVLNFSLNCPLELPCAISRIITRVRVRDRIERRICDSKIQFSSGQSSTQSFDLQQNIDNVAMCYVPSDRAG